MSQEKWNYTDATEKELLKINYGQEIYDQFNEANVLFGTMKKMSDFTGSECKFPVNLSRGAGISSGKPGKSGRNKHASAILRTSKHYATVKVDRETMKATQGSKDAFVSMAKRPLRIANESFNSNLERQMILGDITGSGALATITSVTGTGTNVDPYVCVLPADTVMEQFEEGHNVHIGSDDLLTDVLEVVDVVDGATKSVSLVGSPTTVPAATEVIYIQFAKDSEVAGLQGILKATTGTYKDIEISRRWSSDINDVSGAISTAELNKSILRIEKKCGKPPKMALASYEQYQRLLDLHEDQKTYEVTARGERYSKLSFQGLQVMTTRGAIPVVASRFVPAGEIYLLNPDEMYLKTRPDGFEWDDDYGKVFNFMENEDAYLARYSVYLDFFVNPAFQGILINLTV